jgi:Spy/CpxP family protein refolding chaperone
MSQEKQKMNSRFTLLTVITAALSASGLMAKQDTSLNHRQFNLVDRLSASLNLTDQQKQQAGTIFKSEHEAAHSTRQDLRKERREVQSAIQAGKPVAEVEQLAKQEGPALGDLAGMRAAAFAKLYAVLTPAQQQKLVGLHQEWQRHHAAGS